MEFLQNIRQNLFNTSANQPQQGQGSTFIQRLQDPRFLGLLSAAAAIPKVGTAEGLSKGAQVFNMFSAADEERKRKALVQDLVSKGGFTPQEQALILASQNPAAVAAQIRTQKAAASKPNAFQQRKTIGEQQGLLGDDLQRFILTGELPQQANFELVPADQVEDLGFSKGAILQKNKSTGQVSILRSAPETTATFKYLTKDQKLNLGYDVNSVVQINDQTKQVNVVKDAPKQNEKFTILSADEAATAGYPEGTIVQKSNLTGKQNIIQSVPKKDSNKLTLTESELLLEGFNKGDVVQKDENTGALTVVRSASAPKNTSLVNLVSQQDVTIDGRTIKAGTVFALDQTTQQAQLLEAGKQGAIIAPSKVEQITSPTVDTSKVDELVSSIAADTSDTSLNLNVGTAAGGDIPGVVTDVLNTVVGAFTGSFSPDRKRQVAVLNEANNTIKVPLVKALNRAGSKFAIEQVDTILPQPSNQNETFIQRFDALKPRLDIAIKQLAADSLNTELTESERIAAKDEARQLIEYQQNMQTAIDVYRKNRGGTKSETQKKADEILGF